MSETWHVLMRGKEHGPYDFAQLRDMHFQGMLQADSELRSADGQTLKAGDIPNLFDKHTEQIAASEEAPAAHSETASTSTEEFPKTAEEERADEFGVYSSEIKEPGLVQMSDFMTPKVVVAVMAVLAYLIYVTLVTDHYTDTQAKAQKKIQQIEAQQRMMEQMDRYQYNTGPNITPEQIGEAMRQSQGY